MKQLKPLFLIIAMLLLGIFRKRAKSSRGLSKQKQKSDEMKWGMFAVIILLVMPTAFAGNWTNNGKSYVTDFRVLNEDRFKDIDYGNLTARIDYAQNLTMMGYLYWCSDRFEGSNISNCWTSNTEAVTSSNYARGGSKSLQLGVGAAVDANIRIDPPASNVILTMEGWEMNWRESGTDTFTIRPHDSPVTLSLDLGFPDTSKWYARATGGANTLMIDWSNQANSWSWFQHKGGVGSYMPMLTMEAIMLMLIQLI